MEDIEVLKFYAHWCGPCRVYGRTFAKVVNALDVPHREINIDESPEEAQKYGVVSLPTTVVLNKGTVKHKRIGTLLYRDLEEIIRNEVAYGS